MIYWHVAFSVRYQAVAYVEASAFIYQDGKVSWLIYHVTDWKYMFPLIIW